MSATKICPYCAEDVRVEAIKCKHCGSYIGRGSDSRRPPMSGEWLRSDQWVRSNSDRMIAGVCGGLAELLGLPSAVIRLAFVLGTILSSGIGIVAYVVLAIVMPLDVTARHRKRARDIRERRAPADPDVERELGPDDPR